MIGYVCKYTPIAIFAGFEEEGIKLNSEVHNFDLSDSLTHPNMCSYSKAIIQETIEKDIKKLVLVTCCDSIRRVKDVLGYSSKERYVYIIDLPRKNSCCSKMLFKNSLIKFIKNYEEFSGKTFNIDLFKKAFKFSNGEEREEEDYIAVVGARISNSLFEDIKNISPIKIVNETCTDYCEKVSYIPDSDNLDELMEWYAGELLNQRACMRMEDISSRRELLENPKVLGIIYHTVKFCDYYHFEYSDLKDSTDIPILKIETDYTKQSEGQIRTRIEAFIESLKGRYECVATKIEERDEILNFKEKEDKFSNYSVKDKILVAGIDSGSTSTNAVILDQHKNIVTYSVVKTGAKCIDGANKALEVALKNCGLNKEDLKFILATGYGRVSIPFGDENITEITCHARGAYFLNKNIRTVIDIGGQDSKVIKLDENGNVKDFVMNDKCAAGTGRFIDMMARTLELDIDQMGKNGLKWKEDIVISNMCTVFAESEIISLIAQNKEKSDIIHGLNKSIAGKIVSLINRVGKNEVYMMTGGVAKNIGVVKEIEKLLGSKIFIWDEPQICGAIGAALIALERMKN